VVWSRCNPSFYLYWLRKFINFPDLLTRFVSWYETLNQLYNKTLFIVTSNSSPWMAAWWNCLAIKVRGKIHSVKFHEDTDWKQRNSYTLSLTSAALPPGMTRYPFIGSWVSSMASRDGCGKSRPYWDSNPRESNPYRLHYPVAQIYSLCWESNTGSSISQPNVYPGWTTPAPVTDTVTTNLAHT
jgi:hypothetical protein